MNAEERCGARTLASRVGTRADAWSTLKSSPGVHTRVNAARKNACATSGCSKRPPAGESRYSTVIGAQKEIAPDDPPHSTLAKTALHLIARYDSLRLQTYRDREHHGDRIRLAPIGSATALRFDDVGYFNKVYSPDESAARRLPEIEMFYQGCSFGCELIGPIEGSGGEIGRACRDRGWAPGRRYAWLHAPMPATTELHPPTVFRIRPPEMEQRASFLLTYLRAFEAQPDRFDAALRNMRHLFHLRELEFLMAWHGNQPAGIGMLYRAGKTALLCAGATLPEYRRRGCHTALVAARIRLAREQGCEEIFASAIPDGQSQTNMHRAGLRTVGATAAWRLDPDTRL